MLMTTGLWPKDSNIQIVSFPKGGYLPVACGTPRPHHEMSLKFSFSTALSHYPIVVVNVEISLQLQYYMRMEKTSPLE
jgi:hypothetical protein